MKNRIDQEIYDALASNNQVQLEKVVTQKIKALLEKQKADQERILKLHNADPNDVEAQKQIEEEIRKNVIESNY